MKRAIRFSALVLALMAAWGQTAKPPKTEEEIKQAIIRESIANYGGARVRITPTGPVEGAARGARTVDGRVVVPTFSVSS